MINEELEKNYNQKIKELAMKNKNINKVSSRIFEYEQEIKEIKKQIENENQILLQLKKDYKNLSDEAEKIRKLS
jgi:archaellum component FlaC